jgi:hypothetical protein
MLCLHRMLSIQIKCTNRFKSPILLDCRLMIRNLAEYAQSLNKILGMMEA